MITYPISTNLYKKIDCNGIRFTILHLAEAATGGVPLKKVFLEIPQNSQEDTCGTVSFSIKLQAEATAFDLSRVFSWRFRVFHHSHTKKKFFSKFHFVWNKKKKKKKKWKYPDGVQIFTFLLEYRVVWRQSF